MRIVGWAGVDALRIVSCLLLAACNPSGTDGDGRAGGAGGESTEETGPPAGWPRVVVVGPGTGTDPTLYTGPEPDAAAFGYLAPGVRVRLEGAPRGGRVEVRVAGALPVRYGWIPLDRVAAYAQQRGRVQGTPFYLGPNDLVSLLGPADNGRMRVAVRPWLGGGLFLDPGVGTFPAEQLGDRPVERGQAEGPTEGACYRLPPRQTVPVYERPGGTPIVNLPAQDPPLTVVVLRERAPWYGIRAGYGPYVVGYVQGPLTPCEGARPEPEPMVPRSSGAVPHWVADEEGTLHRVAAGTRVEFNGRTVARLSREGWARELGREPDDMVDVFVAVDGEAALRGLVPASALSPAE
jgi:hypothetical protein